MCLQRTAFYRSDVFGTRSSSVSQSMHALHDIQCDIHTCDIRLWTQTWQSRKCILALRQPTRTLCSHSPTHPSPHGDRADHKPHATRAETVSHVPFIPKTLRLECGVLCSRLASYVQGMHTPSQASRAGPSASRPALHPAPQPAHTPSRTQLYSPQPQASLHAHNVVRPAPAPARARRSLEYPTGALDTSPSRYA